MAIGPALALAVVLGCSGATPTPSPSSAPATPSPSVSALTQSSTAAGSSSLLKPQALGTVDGAPLGYMEYLPPGYGDGSARPLLLAFHGSGESGTGDTGSLYKLVGTGVPWVMVHDRWPLDRPFVVLAPQHDDSGDEACTTSDEVNDFLDFALKHYQVDPTGVYLTGYSCGAVGVWDYLGDHTNEAVAAAVPIAGDGRPAIEKAGCDLGKVPIWAFHGDLDGSMDPAGSEIPINTLKSCTDPPPVDAELTMFANQGHLVWDQIYDTTLGSGIDIYSWLLGHAKR